MSDGGSDALPILALGAMQAEDAAARCALAGQLDLACRELGFLVVSEHGLDVNLLRRVFRSSAAFFDQPVETKMQAHPTRAGLQRGYHAFETRGLAATLGREAPPDLRESLFVGPLSDHGGRFADLPGGSDAYADNLWPSTPASLAADLRALYRAFEALSRRLLRLMAVALDSPEDHFEGMIRRHFSIMACHHYPPLTVEPRPGQLRTGEHTDFGAFTVLAMTRGEGGLEVRMPDGHWRGVRIDEDALVVNLGDMMARWTEDRWCSTLHRVAAPRALGEARTRRQSIGYFMHPDYDARIHCVPGLAHPGDSARYPETTAGEHIQEKIRRSHPAR